MRVTKRQIIDTFTTPSLAAAVIDNFGGWSDFKESAPDVARHGIDGGFGNWIYYADTVKFAEDYWASIHMHGKQLANDLGEPGFYSMVADFNCLHGMTADTVADAIHDPNSDDYTQVMNALAWFAAEEVCRAYVNQIDD